MLPWFAGAAFRNPRVNAWGTLALRDTAIHTSRSVADPPKFSAKDSHPVRAKDVDYYGDLCASPPKFAVGGSEGVAFKLSWEHDLCFVE